ncbi:MAG: hypothetical protein IPN05_17675 [Sulfuritalea sp.]|nr:hypothetical protein [Sulfuritalea sp.]
MDRSSSATCPPRSGAATGRGYSHDTTTLLAVTQYLRQLGYGRECQR